MIIKRDERILDARYLSREGDTGTRWWSAMRGRNRLSVFNGSVVSSEVALGGKSGQLVFSSNIIPSGGTSPSVVVGGVAVIAPILNPSAVRVRITNSPYTGVPGYLGITIPSLDGTWLIPNVGGVYFSLYTNLGINLAGLEQYPRIGLACNAASASNGLQAFCESGYGPFDWGYSDANTTTVAIGAYYGVIPASTFIVLAQPPSYSPPGYGTVEVLEWIP